MPAVIARFSTRRHSSGASSLRSMRRAPLTSATRSSPTKRLMITITIAIPIARKNAASPSHSENSQPSAPYRIRNPTSSRIELRLLVLICLYTDGPTSPPACREQLGAGRRAERDLRDRPVGGLFELEELPLLDAP